MTFVTTEVNPSRIIHWKLHGVEEVVDLSKQPEKFGGKGWHIYHIIEMNLLFFRLIEVSTQKRTENCINETNQNKIYAITLININGFVNSKKI